jgi:hypothetical protein
MYTKEMAEQNKQIKNACLKFFYKQDVTLAKVKANQIGLFPNSYIGKCQTRCFQATKSSFQDIPVERLRNRIAIAFQSYLGLCRKHDDDVSKILQEITYLAR